MMNERMEGVEKMHRQGASRRYIDSVIGHMDNSNKHNDIGMSRVLITTKGVSGIVVGGVMSYPLFQ